MLKKLLEKVLDKIDDLVDVEICGYGLGEIAVNILRLIIILDIGAIIGILTVSL